MILLIDNYDSFTYNLAHLFGELGADVVVRRNDEISPDEATLDTCIAIRTIVLRDGVAHLQAGAGIVVDSDPAAEHEECLRKLAAVEAAIDLAEAEQA